MREPARATLRIAESVARCSVPVPKEEVIRSAKYRRIVASYPCIQCGAVGRSQAAHAGSWAGKAGARKATDLALFALCADEPGRRGCHSLWDQGGLVPKEQRPDIERRWVQEQIRRVIRDKRWPADLPMPDPSMWER